jgi:hypothetical protein
MDHRKAPPATLDRRLLGGSSSPISLKTSHLNAEEETYPELSGLNLEVLEGDLKCGGF